MFKSVATKLAHNTTVPSLGGNKDLRGLQDLITAEKTVLSSSQKFALDLAKSAEALKHWGMGEGDDLGDISTAATTLMLHLAGAINHFSNIEGSIREQMKAVRSREEALDEMKRRRRTTGSRAEDAERKLSKMNPENKNLQSQTATLAQLRDDIRLLDADIMNEEAGISDYKRQSMKSWLGHKFGGIQDFCEKGLIVSDLGKQLISVIPLEQTQPGLPRAYYMGHQRTEAIISEAQFAVQEVVFSTEPGTGRRAGGSGQQLQAAQPPSAEYGMQPQPTGQSYNAAGQNRPLSSQFTPTAASTYAGQIMMAGDKPGETLMRAQSISQGSTYQSQAGSLPTSPQSYAAPQGPPPGQGYPGQALSSPTQQQGNYPTRASFIGLPQLSQQQTGSDLGMNSYLSPTNQDTSLPAVPEQQQQQHQSPYPQQQAGYPQQPQSSYGQPPSPYQQQQQYPGQNHPGQNPGQQPHYPEPQTYPTLPNQPQHPMPQGNYANLTYPQSPGTQPQSEVNEFGTYSTPSGVYAARSSSLRHARQGADSASSPTDPSSGRFSTFPVKTTGPRPQPGAASPPPPGAEGAPGSPALEQRVPSLEVNRQDSASFSSSIAAALQTQWQIDRNSQVLSQGPGAPEQYQQQQYQQQQSQQQSPYHDPRQSYYQDPQQSPYHHVEQSEAATAGHAPHPSVATTSIPPPYDDAVTAVSSEHPSEDTQEPIADSAVLAYMSDPEHGDAAGSEGSHGDKMVRFGSVRDVDQEMAKRRSHGSEAPQQSEIPPVSAENSSGHASHEASQVPSAEHPQNAPSSPPVVTPHRAPTPSEEGRGDEAALNAAAAREVSRELDQLMFSSQQPQAPPPQPAQAQPASDARANSPPQPASQSSYQQPSYQPSYTMHRAQSPPTSPTSGSREPQYVREKDRSPAYPSRQPTPSSPPADSQTGDQSPLIPPPTIGSPAGGSTASFRTPPEYPAAPTSPGSFYALGQTATGSATSFIPGANPRTISAAAFKRQVRQPTNPANLPIDTTPGGGGGITDTSPLHVRKRLPGSPLLAGGGAAETQRIPSAPVGGGGNLYSDPYANAHQYRSASANYAQPQPQHPQSRDSYQPYGQQQGQQQQHDEEDYDYLSAYMSNDEEHGASQGGGLR